MNKSFVLADVKTIESTAPAGEFESILSAPTLDRDGEVIDALAFTKAPGGLPPSIPIHAFHDFADPIGRGVPEYRDGVLYLKGFFASTPRAQEIRALVTEGVIAHMSVGFMPPVREEKDGVTHIVAAELLEGSFVSIPSNREAAVLAAKSFVAEGKRGRVLSAKNESDLRQIVEIASRILDQISGSDDEPEKTAATDPEEKAAAPAAAAPPADVTTGTAWIAALCAEAEVALHI